MRERGLYVGDEGAGDHGAVVPVHYVMTDGRIHGDDGLLLRKLWWKQSTHTYTLFIKARSIGTPPEPCLWIDFHAHMLMLMVELLTVKGIRYSTSFWISAMLVQKHICGS